MFNGLAEPATPISVTGVPSITISGSLEPAILALPRIRIRLPAPGAPPSVVICAPATLPLINCSADVTLPCKKSFDLIEITEPVKSFFLTVP